jgi:galactokinase
VLAAAIDKHIVISARETGDGTIDCIFADFDPQTVHSIDPSGIGDWRITGGAQSPADFVRGTIGALNGRGIAYRPGLQIVVSGDLPHGVGISSSAALCVSLVQAFAIEPIPPADLVLIAQDGENRTGSPCGSMDQSASVFGGIIEFDGSTNRVAQLPAVLGELEFVVANSGVVRSLATSSYPERVREAKAAVAKLREVMAPDLQALAELPADQLTEAIRSLETEQKLCQRVRHVVTETGRVREGKDAVAANDWIRFGEIMTAGGRSSARDYDISHPVVESLVSISGSFQAVLGARMMGGGEGGSALLLIRSSGWTRLRDRLAHEFYRPRGFEDIDEMLIRCRFAPGASVRICVASEEIPSRI